GGGYKPAGMLLWLPAERRYGTWDSSHLGIHIFPEGTTWADMVADPVRYFNAQWGNWTREQTLVPWPRHPYHKTELYGPRPLALLNDPNFVRECVPLSRSRRALLVEATRGAADCLKQKGQAPAPDDLGFPSCATLGQSLAEIAAQIDGGDTSRLHEVG